MNTTSTTYTDELTEARARRAALPKTPMGPQTGNTPEGIAQRKAQAAKRANAPLYPNTGFSLLK